jgi:hypothetical protein
MAGVADGLAERDIATLRYQFPYMEGAASARTKNRSGHRPRTGRKDDDLGAEMLDNLSGWLKAVVPRPFAESRGNLNCDSRFLKPILKERGVGLHEKGSALSLKADILQGG